MAIVTTTRGYTTRLSVPIVKFNKIGINGTTGAFSVLEIPFFKNSTSINLYDTTGEGSWWITWKSGNTILKSKTQKFAETINTSQYWCNFAHGTPFYGWNYFKIGDNLLANQEYLIKNINTNNFNYKNYQFNTCEIWGIDESDQVVKIMTGIAQNDMFDLVFSCDVNLKHLLFVVGSRSVDTDIPKRLSVPNSNLALMELHKLIE